MTTGIAALDFLLAGFALAWLLLFAYAARQWIVRHTGRAKPLPDIDPDRDEATLCCADEGGVVVSVDDWGLTQPRHFLANKPARMQGNSAAREWPFFSYDERLPRRAAD